MFRKGLHHQLQRRREGGKRMQRREERRKRYEKRKIQRGRRQEMVGLERAADLTGSKRMVKGVTQKKTKIEREGVSTEGGERREMTDTCTTRGERAAWTNQRQTTGGGGRGGRDGMETRARTLKTAAVHLHTESTHDADTTERRRASSKSQR